MGLRIGPRSLQGSRLPSIKTDPLSVPLHLLLRNRRVIAGAVIILLLSIGAVAAPLIAPESPRKQNFDAILESSSLDHPLGTDRLGRDTLSRLIYGARTSLAVGVFPQLIVLALGIPFGIAAGLATNRVDNLLMRGVDVVYAVPDLLLIILLRAIFGGGVSMMILAIGLVSWPTIARLVRGQTLSFKEREYVLAARVMGATEVRIIYRHLLPNILGPVIVALTFLVPRAIFAEAALSFIGIGIEPPTPSWGAMIDEGYQVIFATYQQILYPTIAIALLMMAFTFLADGLRDLLDPRTRAR